LTGEVVEGGIMPKLLSAIALRESSGFWEEREVAEDSILVFWPVSSLFRFEYDSLVHEFIVKRTIIITINLIIFFSHISNLKNSEK
jgi:hypothetical protein